MTGKAARCLLPVVLLVACAGPGSVTRAGGWIGEGAAIHAKVGERPAWHIEVRDGDLRLASGGKGLVVAAVARDGRIYYETNGQDAAVPDFTFALGGGRKLTWRGDSFTWSGQDYRLPDGKTQIIDQDGAIGLVGTLWTTWPRR